MWNANWRAYFKSSLEPRHVANETLGFQAIFDCLSATGIPPALIWVQLCAVVSVLTQGLANVQWPNGQLARIGANGLLVAPSSSGKSVIFKILNAPIEECADNELAAASRFAGSLLIEDVSPSAVVLHLNKVRFAGIFTDEAAALKALDPASALLAKLLEGTPFRKMRQHDAIVLRGHRLTMLTAIQPGPFSRSKLFSTLPGNDGLINRFMVGTASFANTEFHTVALTDALRLQHRARVFELLARSAQNVNSELKELPTLVLSEVAKRFLVDSGSKVRSASLGPTQAPSLEAEYGARHLERTLKLAGSIHLYNGGIAALDSKIELNTVQVADWIGHLGLEGYREVTHKPVTLNAAEKDAEKIVSDLNASYAQTGDFYFELRLLRKLAPNIGMTSARVNQALPLLIASGHGSIVMMKNKDFLMLHPCLPHHSLTHMLRRF